MSYNQPQADNTFRVINMKMLETPATAPIYRRKLQSNITDRTVRMYEDASRGGQLHSPALLAGVANSALYYGTDSEAVQMPGGYSESRYRVVIEFLETQMGSTENISYITGYTDQMDSVQTSGNGYDFPGEMRFFFNEIRTASTRRGNNIRNGTIRHVRDNSQIFSRIDADPTGQFKNTSDTHLLTPGVITQVMQANSLHETLGLQQHEIEINDTRTSLMMQNNYRSRANNRVRSDYMSLVMDGYSRSRHRDVQGHETSVRVLADAVQHSGDASLVSSRFFENILAETDYDFNGYVTWRELIRVFPEILGDDCDVAVHPLSHGRLVQTPSVENCTPWYDNTLETTISNIIVSGIPAMLPDLLLEEVHFTIHNDTVDGGLYVAIENYATMFDDLDRREEIKGLEFRIEQHLFMGCDFLNNVMFHAQGVVSLPFECVVGVSVDDAETQVYRYPNWGSALGTSLVSSNQSDVYNLADDFRKLMDVVDNSVDGIREQLTIHIPTHHTPRRRGGI